MAFKEVASLDAEVAYALGAVDKKTGKKSPVEVEGYYLGFKIIPNKMAQSGEAKFHVFQTAKGNHGIYGKTDLDSKLMAVPKGTMCRAKFVKELPTKFGNNKRIFSVQLDPDNVLDMSSQETVQSSAPDDEPDPVDEEESLDDVDEISEADLIAEVKARELAEERKKKVAALLKKGK